MRNTEAGVDLEEYRLKEIVDRVSTVGIGWLGLSVGCAECHSHKFDPISHREFYSCSRSSTTPTTSTCRLRRPASKSGTKRTLKTWSRRRHEAHRRRRCRVRPAQDAKPVVAKLAGAWPSKRRSGRPSKRSSSTTCRSRSDDERSQGLCDAYAAHVTKKPAPPSTKVMTVAARKTTRTSYVHLRGDYRSRGEDVAPGTPAVLPPLKPRGEQADRLDLARWLVDPANPLTPRVTVNHIWQHLFGRGLVSTVDNFGSGGEAPSHPELLDWLAGEFVDRSWSRKAMIRLIVTSATYRQSSADAQRAGTSRSAQRAAGPAIAVAARGRSGSRRGPGGLGLVGTQDRRAGNSSAAARLRGEHQPQRRLERSAPVPIFIVAACTSCSAARRRIRCC